MQISFHMACSMPFYHLGRKQKGRKLRNGLLSLQPAQESLLCLLTHLSPLQRTEHCAGGNSGTGTQSCFIWAPPFPKHDGSVIQSDGNTKEDWDFTVSTQNKWVWQKRNSCLCKKKTSWAVTENGISRKVLLPWEKSPGCRGRLGQRSCPLLGLSSWQAKTNSITKSQLYTAKTILAFAEWPKKPEKKKKINVYLSPFLSSLQEVSQWHQQDKKDKN